MGSAPQFLQPPPLRSLVAKVRFSGDRGEFFRLVRNGAALELVTFGFYRFWLATDIRRHLWAHTNVGGDTPEYTGRGRELLVGFLFALAILAPIYLAYFLIGIEVERFKAFASIPLVLFFYLFGQFAIYRARRYRLTRTVWRGVRFWMDGSGWAYAARALGWNLLTSFSIGFAVPWREAALERYKMRHCHYGDLPGSFEATGWEFFKRGWLLWLAAISPLILIIVEAVARSFVKLPPIGNFITGLLALIYAFALPFIYGAFKAVEWRWWISGIRFGDVSFKSDLSASALFGVYWKVIGWLVLIFLTLGALLSGVARSVIGVSDPKLALALLQGNIPLLVTAIVGYLAAILAANVVVRVYLTRDVWAKAAASTTVHHLEAAANVAAKGELSNALGEGLADGLDVAGF